MGDTPASPAVTSSSSVSRIFEPRTLEDDFHLYEKKDEIEATLTKIEEIYTRVKLDKEPNLPPPPADGGRRGGERKRPRADRDMNQRSHSHDGLIAFLTCLFPYLTNAEARAYLYAADLDPLVAALLVVDHRRMRRFGFSSGITVAAVEAALR
nr:unnamed protein product [Digitaria exilis]